MELLSEQNAPIVCGHNTWRGAMVTVVAVVTKDVPAYALMAGSTRTPCRMGM